MSELLSFRKYALHRGVTIAAVSKAVATGRITPVVDTDGRRLIDPQTADAEWVESRDPSKVRGGDHQVITPSPVITSTASAASAASAAVTVNVRSGSDEEFGSDEAGEKSSVKYQRARAEKEEFAARTAELTYLEKSGQLVPAAEITAKWAEMATLVKTKLLGLPSKARQAMPDSVTPEMFALLDRIVREALEELAGGES